MPTSTLPSDGLFRPWEKGDFMAIRLFDDPPQLHLRSDKILNSAECGLPLRFEDQVTSVRLDEINCKPCQRIVLEEVMK
jgi:hypothetical protein